MNQTKSQSALWLALKTFFWPAFLFQPEKLEMVEVTNKRAPYRDEHYIKVRLADGSRHDIRVSAQTYEETGISEYVEVYIKESAHNSAVKKVRLA